MREWIDADDIRAGRAVVGIDEAGRGCLAGPVYAAAFLGVPALFSADIDDSKRMSPARREKTLDAMRPWAIYAVGTALPREIERLNIRKASELAMLRAYGRLAALLPKGACPHILVDGNHAPDFGAPCRTVVKGDAKCLSIAAASVVAKTARDAYMAMASDVFPAYGWRQNAGYPVKSHKDALARLGLTPLHRVTYAPVAALLAG